MCVFLNYYLSTTFSSRRGGHDLSRIGFGSLFSLRLIHCRCCHTSVHFASYSFFLLWPMFWIQMILLILLILLLYLQQYCSLVERDDPDLELVTLNSKRAQASPCSKLACLNPPWAISCLGYFLLYAVKDVVQDRNCRCWQLIIIWGLNVPKCSLDVPKLVLVHSSGCFKPSKITLVSWENKMEILDSN